MADKKYKLNFTMTDGSERSVEFDAPQGPQGEKGEQGEGVFAFTFRGNETCQVTAEEVYAAVEAGNVCVAVDNIIGRTYVYHGKAPYNEDASYSVPTFIQPTFMNADYSDFRFMQIDPNGISRNFIRQDVRIPNPRKIIFTGAVNKTYDGSQEVTISIPSESGGSGTVSSDDIFVVRFSHADGTADKTQAEINEAVSGGKVCIALDASGHVYVYAGVQHGNSDATLRVPTFVDNANYNEDGTLVIEYVQFYSDGTVETFYREANLSGAGGSSGLPEPAGPHMQLVTDKDGNWTQEERLAYKYGGTVEILKETTIASSDGPSPTITEKPAGNLVVGNTYTVTWNGMDYKCVALGLTDEAFGDVVIPAVGNAIVNGGDDDGIPFVIAFAPEELVEAVGGYVAINIIHAPEDVDSLTFKIVEDNTTVKTVPFEFLPEGVGGVVEVVVLPEKTLTAHEADGGLMAVTDPLNASITVGGEYTVVWNGTEYKCIAQGVDADGITVFALGNIGAMEGGIDTGEPFVIVDGSLYGEGISLAIVSIDGSTTATVSISGETIKKIPAKYLDTAEIEDSLVSLSEDIAAIKKDDGEVVTRTGTVVSITAEDGENVTVSGDDVDEVTVVCQGKNFFPEFPAYNKNGLVGTQNADGSYTISGTYTGTSKAYIAPIANTTPRYLPAGTYTASSSLVEGSGINRPVIGWEGNASQKQSFWAGSPQQFTLDEPVAFYCFIEILPGAVVDATFWAQLERGTKNTEYEVHRRTEVTGYLPVDVTCDEGDNLLYCESGNAITAAMTRNITGLIADKLDKNLGQENYHSVLAVGETGDVVPLPNPLTGKKIAFLGDSITTTYYAHNYWQMIAEKTGCVPLNYGKSKSRIATVEGDDVESFVTRAATMDTSADAVFVMGGTNDCQLKTKLGAWDSTDASTFYGGLNALITLLRTNYPGKPIVFATPIKRKADTDNGFPDTMADLKTASADEDITMQHCVLAIKAKCARHGIPVVDLAEHSGIGAECTEYFGVDDSLHPSELGYVRIANMVQAELEKQFRHTL